MSRQALLVVSFGTSYKDGRKRAIETLEADLKQQFPGYDFFHAYTSGVIRKIIEREEGLHIPSVEEAMQKITAGGYEELLVQPTHVIDGIENNLMKDAVLSCQKEIGTIRIGEPLLTKQEDYEICVDTLMNEWREDLTGDTVMLLMGHGTSHEKNACYEQLNSCFHEKGHPNVYVGTVEALPDLQALIEQIRPFAYRRVLIAPFMLVAGDHAHNDMAGEEADSWKRVLEGEGYEVLAKITGLGELQAIRDLYCAHALATQKQ